MPSRFPRRFAFASFDIRRSSLDCLLVDNAPGFTIAADRSGTYRASSFFFCLLAHCFCHSMRLSLFCPGTGTLFPLPPGRLVPLFAGLLVCYQLSPASARRLSRFAGIPAGTTLDDAVHPQDTTDALDRAGRKRNKAGRAREKTAPERNTSVHLQPLASFAPSQIPLNPHSNDSGVRPSQPNLSRRDLHMSRRMSF